MRTGEDRGREEGGTSEEEDRRTGRAERGKGWEKLEERGGVGLRGGI